MEDCIFRARGPGRKKHLTVTWNTSGKRNNELLTNVSETIYDNPVATVLSKQTIRISCNSETIKPRNLSLVIEKLWMGTNNFKVTGGPQIHF